MCARELLSGWREHAGGLDSVMPAQGRVANVYGAPGALLY